MNNIKRNIKGALLVLLTMYAVLIGYFVYTLFVYGERWFSDPYNSRIRMDSQDYRIIPGDITDRKGIVLSTTKTGKRKNSETGVQEEYYYRAYHSEINYAAHVVGYQQGGIGAEVMFVRYLLGYNNSIFERVYQKAFLPREQGNDVALTIDFGLQKYISQLMGNRKGSVVLMNPNTGEILAMVSYPSFSPTDRKEDLGKDSLINRATQGYYPPGSIFKIVTAAAALDKMEDIMDMEFHCDGSTQVNGITVNCYNDTAHGTINLKQAMEVSCNAAFAELAFQVGWNELFKTGEGFGFNYDFLFSDIKVNASSLPLNRRTTQEELAWHSVGQGAITVTPLHMAMIASTIANDGIMMEPRLIFSVTGRRGNVQKSVNPKRFRTPITYDNAQIIKGMLRGVVENGTGREASGSGLSVAGKTGTAQTGPDSAPHAWFIGFAPVENPTLAIAVIIENGGTGGSQAAPLAGNILIKAREMGY